MVQKGTKDADADRVAHISLEKGEEMHPSGGVDAPSLPHSWKRLKLGYPNMGKKEL